MKKFFARVQCVSFHWPIIQCVCCEYVVDHICCKHNVGNANQSECKHLKYTKFTNFSEYNIQMIVAVVIVAHCVCVLFWSQYLSHEISPNCCLINRYLLFRTSNVQLLVFLFQINFLCSIVFLFLNRKFSANGNFSAMATEHHIMK